MSTKFCVEDPVPPWAIGTTPVMAITGVCPPVEVTTIPSPATDSTPALEMAGLAEVPPIVMPLFPEATELTPVTGPVDPLKLSTPVLLIVLPTMLMPLPAVNAFCVPGKVCPAAKAILPSVPIIKPLSAAALPFVAVNKSSFPPLFPHHRHRVGLVQS